MTGVKGVGSAALPTASFRRAAPGPGFAVLGGAGPLAAAAAMPAGSVGGMLLLQQEMDSGPARDRHARRHGRAMLDALAELQHALLVGDEDPAVLGRLAALLQHCPEASDPGLRATVGAVVVRVHVELARRSC